MPLSLRYCRGLPLPPVGARLRSTLEVDFFKDKLLKLAMNKSLPIAPRLTKPAADADTASKLRPVALRANATGIATRDGVKLNEEIDADDELSVFFISPSNSKSASSSPSSSPSSRLASVADEGNVCDRAIRSLEPLQRSADPADLCLAFFFGVVDNDEDGVMDAGGFFGAADFGGFAFFLALPIFDFDFPFLAPSSSA